MTTLAFIEGLGSPVHWLILGIIMLLLFGRRLPEVGRNLGRGITEFKRGLKDVQDQANQEGNDQSPPNQAPYAQQQQQPQPYQPRAYVSQQPAQPAPPRLQPPAATNQQPVHVTRQDMVD